MRTTCKSSLSDDVHSVATISIISSIQIFKLTDAITSVRPEIRVSAQLSSIITATPISVNLSECRRDISEGKYESLEQSFAVRTLLILNHIIISSWLVLLSPQSGPNQQPLALREDPITPRQTSTSSGTVYKRMILNTICLFFLHTTWNHKFDAWNRVNWQDGNFQVSSKKTSRNYHYHGPLFR